MTFRIASVPHPLILALFLFHPVFGASEKAEREAFILGMNAALSIERRQGVVEEHPQWERIMDVTSRILVNLESSTLYTVQVIHAPMANAFALPGGFFFITDRLLEMDLSDEELAFLIGHEISHVQKDHFEKLEKQQMKVGLMNVLAVIGAVALIHNESGDDARRLRQQGAWTRPGPPPVESRSSGPFPSVLAPILAGNLFGTLYLLNSQRDLELEADLSGARLALDAGYSLKGGLGLLQKLFYTNFQNIDQRQWQTHPLAKEREDRLRAILAEKPAALRKSEEYMQEFRRTYADRVLALYERIPSWKKRRSGGDEDEDMEEARLMLLKRTLRFSRADEIRKKALKHEIFNHLLPLTEKTPFLLADYGVLNAKIEELSALEEAVDKDVAKKVTDKAALCLSTYLEDSKKSAPGFEQCRFLLKNYPSHPLAADWKWQAWLKNPDVEARIKEAKELKNDAGRPVKEELSAMLSKEEDFLNLRRLDAVMEKEVEEKKLAELLEKSQSMERMAIYQHEFPEDASLEKVLKRRSDMAERKIQEGRLATMAGNFQKALDSYRDILLYDRGSKWEEQARSLIYRMNVLSRKGER